MSTLYDISSINVEGGIFERETKLGLFDDTEKVRFSLVYGKNGSGKSTIARAFNSLVNDDEIRIKKVEILDKSGNCISLNEDEKKSIFVFNEEFIEQNIKIDTDGLNAIVVMGEEKSIDDKIKELMPKYEKIKLEYEQQSNKCEEYLDSGNNCSPLFYEKEMVKKLQGDKNWAGRDARIRSNKRNSSVNLQTYKKFIGLNTKKTRDELIIEYNQLEKEFESAKNGSKLITKQVYTSYKFNNIENDVRLLLAEKIEKPILTNREKYLFSLLSKEDGEQHLQQVKAYFDDTAHRKCPYCFQDVNEKYASELVESIEKILSKKAEEHKEKLEKMVALQYEFDDADYKELDKELLDKCIEKLQKVNAAAEQLNSMVSEKKGNVYIAIELPKIDLKDKFDDFIIAMKELETKRKEYNSKVTDLKPIIKKMTKVNDLIAMYDIDDLHKKLNLQLEKKKKENEILQNKKQEMINIEKKLTELNEKKRMLRLQCKQLMMI